MPVNLGANTAAGAMSLALPRDPNAVEWPERLSVSSANTFNQCPRKWLLEKIGRQPDPSGVDALRGNLVHTILEYLYERPEDQRGLDDIRALAAEHWDEFTTRPDWAELQLTDPEDVKAFKWSVIEAADGLMEMEDPSTINPIARERRIECELDGVPFVGIVDRVDQTPAGRAVIDYKSGKWKPPKFQGDVVRQILLYAAATIVEDGVWPYEGRAMYVKVRRTLRVTVTPATVGNAVDEFADTWERIQEAKDTEWFPPDPAPLCGWCPHVAGCEAGLAFVRERAAAGKLKKAAPAWAVLNAEKVDDE